MSLKNMIAEFQDYLGDNESKIDMHHQNIAGKIKLLWGYPEFYQLMEQLLVVEKDRDRGGFSQEVLLEFSTLQEIHEIKFPNIKPVTISVI